MSLSRVKMGRLEDERNVCKKTTMLGTNKGTIADRAPKVRAVYGCREKRAKGSSVAFVWDMWKVTEKVDEIIAKAG